VSLIYIIKIDDDSTTTGASYDDGTGVQLVGGVQSYQNWTGVRICHFLGRFSGPLDLVRTEERFARSSFKKK
jgi:hypothetical protein